MSKVRTLKLNDRIVLPETTTRSQAKFLIADLYGSDAGAFALADNQAARDSFVARCTALALAAMVYGDASRLERMKKYAATLPGYRTDKAGLPVGKLGKLIAAYSEAVSIGRALASQIDAAADEVSLSVLASSPVFSGLIAPPQAKPKASTPSAGVTASVPTAAPKAEADDDDDDDAIKEARKEAAEAEARKEAAEAEARKKAAEAEAYQQAGLAAEAQENARKEAAEAEAKRRAWLAARAQERARDVAEDHAAAAMEFVALAEMIGIKLTPAQVKKAQAFVKKAQAFAQEQAKFAA